MTTERIRMRKTWAIVLYLSFMAVVTITGYLVAAIYLFAITGWVAPVYSPQFFHVALAVTDIAFFFLMMGSSEVINRAIFDDRLEAGRRQSNG